MEIEDVLPTCKQGAAGNLYKSMYRSSFSSSSRNQGRRARSLSVFSFLSQNKVSQGVDEGNVEVLRARLLAERSVSSTAKRKVEELEQKVRDLERALAAEIGKRRDAEATLQESLEKLLACPSSNSSSAEDTDAELQSLSRAIMSDEGELNVASGNDGPHSSRGLSDQGNGSRRNVATTSPEVPVPHEERIPLPGQENVTAEAEESVTQVCRRVHPSSDCSSSELDPCTSASFRDAPLVGTRLYLTEVGHVRKIGRSTHAVKRKARKPKKSSRNKIEQEELLSELSGWVKHVVSMLEARASTSRGHDSNQDNRSPGDGRVASLEDEHCTDTRDQPALHICRRVEPYISFAKYLGLEDLGDLLVEVETDKHDRMLCRLSALSSSFELSSKILQQQQPAPETCTVDSIDPSESSNTVDTQQEIQVLAESCKESELRLVDKSCEMSVDQSSDEKIEQIFRALSSAKQQLRSSMEERRHSMEKWLSEKKKRRPA